MGSYEKYGEPGRTCYRRQALPLSAVGLCSYPLPSSLRRGSNRIQRFQPWESIVGAAERQCAVLSLWVDLASDMFFLWFLQVAELCLPSDRSLVNLGSMSFSPESLSLHEWARDRSMNLLWSDQFTRDISKQKAKGSCVLPFRSHRSHPQICSIQVSLHIVSLTVGQPDSAGWCLELPSPTWSFASMQPRGHW